MFSLLTARNATVTLCHSRTKNLVQILNNADLVVAAIGIPNYIKGEWLKPGCVVIDVGINSLSG
jgi:methylenetetrahydrofolate dehydrogenase (NADP+)/methenyltetrahydrofolate cyclohydrolase/formyltetrahydrofolate synthetase